jgi:hypothetical protein
MNASLRKPVHMHNPYTMHWRPGPHLHNLYCLLLCRIGLRRLHESGGLLLESAPGEHMQFTGKWFKREVIAKYLSGAAPQH